MKYDSAAARCSTARVSKLIIAVVVCFFYSAAHAQTSQPTPSASSTGGTHVRIPKSDPAGQRFPMVSLKGAVLYLPPQVRRDRSVPLLIHFHGASWLIESHVADSAPHTALVTVNLGAGSRAYGDPFKDASLLQNMLDEAARLSGARRGWASINLSAWSAGYGAVRAILRQNENFRRVTAVLLLDGMHAGYTPDGKPPAAGGSIKADDLDSFVRFAREAVAARKTFIFTHSEIVPPGYASTTECADFVLGAARLRRKTATNQGPIGMRQLSLARSGRLTAIGFAGDAAPDHVDHIHAMPAWFKLLGVR